MIELRNITVERSDSIILEDISLSFHRNQISIIMGPSGAGKSSILKVIMGLWKIKKGQIFINKTNITKIKRKEINKIRQKIGVVFQSNALFDSQTVSENVGFFLREATLLNENEIENRISECLNIVNLSGKESLYPEELSEGMKKRVAIARAISYNPEIILYDEPTTGLDPINSEIVVELIKKLSTNDRTSIIVTHIMRDALKLGDTFSFISGGKLIKTGTESEVFNSDNEEINNFISATND